MKPLLRRLGLGRDAADLAEYEDTQAQLRAISAALHLLGEHARGGQVPADVITTLRAEYEQRAQALEGRLRALNLLKTTLRDRVEGAERRVLLQTEQSTLRDLLTTGEISEDALRDPTTAIDRQLHHLVAGRVPGGEPAAPTPSTARSAPGHRAVDSPDSAPHQSITSPGARRARRGFVLCWIWVRVPCYDRRAGPALIEGKTECA